MRAFVLLLALAPALNATDFKIVTVWYQDVGHMVDNDGQPVRGPGEYIYTDYVKGPWRRSDVPAHGGVPHMGDIENCEKHEFYDINFDSREYQRGKLASYPSEDWWRAFIAAHPPRTSPIASGDLEFDTVDTGETATMFGHPAHRLVTTVKIPPNEEAKRQGWTQVIVDAWYIPLQVPSTDCKAAYMSSNIWTMLTSLDIRPELRHTGPVPKGLAVKVTIKSKTPFALPNGRGSQWVMTSEWDVTELSEAPLDPALFRVPRGFKKVDNLYHH